MNTCFDESPTTAGEIVPAQKDDVSACTEVESSQHVISAEQPVCGMKPNVKNL